MVCYLCNLGLEEDDPMVWEKSVAISWLLVSVALASIAIVPGQSPLLIAIPILSICFLAALAIGHYVVCKSLTGVYAHNLLLPLLIPWIHWLGGGRCTMSDYGGTTLFSLTLPNLILHILTGGSSKAALAAVIVHAVSVVTMFVLEELVVTCEDAGTRDALHFSTPILSSVPPVMIFWAVTQLKERLVERTTELTCCLATATVICEKMVAFKLDNLDILKTQRPTELETMLMRIAENLRLYKSFLPDYMLHLHGENSDSESDDDPPGYSNSAVSSPVGVPSVRSVHWTASLATMSTGHSGGADCIDSTPVIPLAPGAAGAASFRRSPGTSNTTYSGGHSSMLLGETAEDQVVGYDSRVGSAISSVDLQRVNSVRWSLSSVKSPASASPSATSDKYTINDMFPTGSQTPTKRMGVFTRASNRSRSSSSGSSGAGRGRILSRLNSGRARSVRSSKSKALPPLTDMQATMKSSSSTSTPELPTPASAATSNGRVTFQDSPAQSCRITHTTFGRKNATVVIVKLHNFAESSIARSNSLGESRTTVEQLCSEFLTLCNDVTKCNRGVVYHQSSGLFVGTWNIVNHVSNHCGSGLTTATEMAAQLMLLQNRWSKKGWCNLQPAVAVVTGHMVFGFSGSSNNRALVIISPEMELGHSLVDLAEHLSCLALCTEDVVHNSQYSGVVVNKLVDVIEHKGRLIHLHAIEQRDTGGAEWMYELQQVDKASADKLKSYTDAVASFLRRDFNSAIQLFDEHLATNASDAPAARFKHLCEQYLEQASKSNPGQCLLGWPYRRKILPPFSVFGFETDKDTTVAQEESIMESQPGTGTSW